MPQSANHLPSASRYAIIRAPATKATVTDTKDIEQNLFEQSLRKTSREQIIFG